MPEFLRETMTSRPTVFVYGYISLALAIICVPGTNAYHPDGDGSGDDIIGPCPHVFSQYLGKYVPSQMEFGEAACLHTAIKIVTKIESFCPNEYAACYGLSGEPDAACYTFFEGIMDADGMCSESECEEDAAAAGVNAVNIFTCFTLSRLKWLANPTDDDAEMTADTTTNTTTNASCASAPCDCSSFPVISGIPGYCDDYTIDRAHFCDKCCLAEDCVTPRSTQPPPSQDDDFDRSRLTQDGGTCSVSSSCSSLDCRGGNCCNAKGRSDGCTECFGSRSFSWVDYYRGDCSTCSTGYFKKNYECFLGSSDDSDDYYYSYVGMNYGVIAGIGIGSLIGVACLGYACYHCCRKKTLTASTTMAQQQPDRVTNLWPGQGRGTFSDGLFSCGSDLGSACKTMLCPCLSVQHITNVAPELGHFNEWLTCFGIMSLISGGFCGLCGCMLAELSYRQRARQLYGIPEQQGDCPDICAVCCCQCCALSQLHRHVDRYPTQNLKKDLETVVVVPLHHTAAYAETPTSRIDNGEADDGYLSVAAGLGSGFDNGSSDEEI